MSSTAICTASAEPGPVSAEYGPDWSLITPSRTTPSEICPKTGKAAANAAATMHCWMRERRLCFMGLPWWIRELRSMPGREPQGRLGDLGFHARNPGFLPGARAGDAPGAGLFRGSAVERGLGV